MSNLMKIFQLDPNFSAEGRTDTQTWRS